MNSGNPFSSRNIRPGVTPFLLADGRTVGDLIQRLRSQQGWGQILGPHGSGKSTLLLEIADDIRDGKPIRLARLGSHHRRLPWSVRQIARFTIGTQVVIDGFEQLPACQRWFIAMLLRWRRCGLLVTSHQDCGLATLLETKVSLDLARRIVERRLTSSHANLEVSDAFLSRLLAVHGGNMREVLFSLYDWYAAHAMATRDSRQTV